MAVLKTRVDGVRGDLFFLSLRTAFLTLITLGIYRFWARTRLRRWYWSSVRPGGAPLEYTGTALEKLTGFLFAIILLAIFLTAMNLAGIIVTINVMSEIPGAYIAALVGVPLLIVPFLFFARYRARRYILSRSRWRGIRFGMSPGSIGYAWRGTFLLVLTILSAGLLWPLMTFRLEKFLTDRTWYGTERFTQHGGAGRLYGQILPFLVTFWGGIGLMTYWLNAAVTWQDGLPVPNLTGPHWAFFVSLACIPFAIIFAIYYKVASVRVMVALKELGDGIELDMWPKTRRIVGIYFWGWLKTSFFTSFASSVVSGAVFAILWVTGNFDQSMVWNPPVPVATTIGILTFVLVSLMVSVFRQIFITYPLVQHVAETLEIHQPELLASIRQRAHDRRTDGGGFADALDAGAAF